MKSIRMMAMLVMFCMCAPLVAEDMGGFDVEDSRESHDLGNIRELYSKASYEKVIVFFDQFQKDYPRSPNMPEAKFYLALALYKLQDYKKSIDVFSAIEGASEGNLPDQFYEAFGLCYLALGDFPKAEEKLKTAESTSTNQAAVASALGDLYYSTGEFDKAETYLKKAITQNKDLAEAQNNLGLVYMRQKRYTEAKEHFLMALKTGTNVESPYLNLGLIGMVEKDYYSAANNFKFLTTINPNSADYHALFGRSLQGLKKYDESRAEAEKALKIDAKHTGALALIKDLDRIKKGK